MSTCSNEKWLHLQDTYLFKQVKQALLPLRDRIIICLAKATNTDEPAPEEIPGWEGMPSSMWVYIGLMVPALPSYKSFFRLCHLGLQDC